MNSLAKTLKRPIYNVVDRFSFRQNPYYRFFLETPHWSLDELMNYQLQKLKDISRVWGLQIGSWEDFCQLPLQSKKDIWDWRPPDGHKYHVHETSGSTGEPRVIYVPPETWHRKDALFHRSWTLLGRELDQPVLRLIAGTPQYSWYDWWRNDRVMSREITEAHVNYVIRNRPYLVHGPGGAIRILCEEIIRRGREDVLKTMHIEWCSESSQGHKERLEQYVKGFHEQYGLAELPTVGSPCLFNTHVVMETGVVEVIDGEIVVTDFNNYVMPIIRYRTGDEGTISESNCPCGNRSPILTGIKGRRTDYYFGPEVKKPIGWWVVSPIAHQYGQAISAWKAEVLPKQGKFLLRVRFRGPADFDALAPYRTWINRETGLTCEIVEGTATVDWKRDLVRVIDEGKQS